jgi:hypothetical protein
MLIKLRFRFPDILLGALLGVAIFALGAGFWSAQNPEHATEPPSAAHGANEKQQRQQYEGVWNWITHDAAGFFTLWLVIIGGGQLMLFFVQLRLIRESLDDAKVAAVAAKEAADAAQEQTRLARAEFIATHRPRVILREVYFADDKIWFRLVNTGDGKATIVESWLMIETPIVKSALRPLLSTGHNDLGRLVLVGGEMKELDYVPADDFLFILNRQ